MVLHRRNRALAIVFDRNDDAKAQSLGFEDVVVSSIDCFKHLHRKKVCPKYRGTYVWITKNVRPSRLWLQSGNDGSQNPLYGR